MNDRTKLMGSTTIHTPDYDLHDWAYEAASRREDAIDGYISEQLEDLKSLVTSKAPEIFERAIENMSGQKIDRLNRWLFQIWQCRNPSGKDLNSKYAVSIIADMLHDELIHELENEAKAIID